MTSQFPGMTSSSSFFWRCSAFLVNFSYWSKFHVNIIIGSGAITISFHKGLTRNPEFRNTPVWVLPYTLRLGKVRNTKFGTNVSSKMLFNDEKCQVNSFCGFWVIKGKPTGGKITPIPPPRLRLIDIFRFFTYLLYFFFFQNKLHIRGLLSVSLSLHYFPIFTPSLTENCMSYKFMKLTHSVKTRLH